MEQPVEEGRQFSPPSRPTPARLSSEQRASFFRSPAFVVLVALVLRLGVISLAHTYRITPRRDHFQFGWEMGRIARSLATGQGYSSPLDSPSGPTAWAPPLYPYLLAGVFKLFGVYSLSSAWTILAINSLFAALTCLVLYRLGEEIYHPAVGRAAAWTWALFPYAIYWPVRVVWEQSLSALLLAWALLLTLRLERGCYKVRAWIGLGALWGVAALTNPSLLSFLPLSLGWLYYRLRRQGMGVERRIALLLIAGAALISPWLVRNYVVLGKFIFIRDNLWMELHMANNEHSNGLWTRSEHPGNDPAQMQRFAQVGELRYMEEEQQAARAFIGQHPPRFLEFTARRAVYFWIGNPQTLLTPGGYSLEAGRHVAFLLFSLLTLAGLWLSWRQRRKGVFLLACLILVYPLPYYVVHPFTRYRHAIEPEMVLLVVFLLWAARGRELHLPPHRVQNAKSVTLP